MYNPSLRSGWLLQWRRGPPSGLDVGNRGKGHFEMATQLAVSPDRLWRDHTRADQSGLAARNLPFGIDK
jgi:hypothetical protein